VVARGEELALDFVNDLPQVHGDRKPNGMGIGLAICRTIVDAHDARICARNRAERGSQAAAPTSEGAP
jgi:K+-sensing histidine kinase KdpD